MSESRFVVRAAAQRRGSIVGGLSGLGLAAFVCWLGWDVAASLWRDRVLFAMGTEVYRKAEWATMTARTAFVAVGISFVVWMVAHSLRAALRLPRREAPEVVRSLLALRVLVTVVLVIWLLLWSSEETLLRGVEWAPVGALLLGLMVCGNFAWDVPGLIRDGRAALATAMPVLALPVRSLSSLPQAGRVRVRGTIAAATEVITGTDGTFGTVPPGPADESTSV